MSSAIQTQRPLTGAPRILIVDDDRRVRELLEIALSSHGFAVITAADGDEAILRAQSERPDLVLLDMRLPKRSGLEVCDALRNDPADPTVPIVMISAAAEAEQRLHAFTRGADDYLAKPFSPKELVARLRRLLARATESRVALKRMQDLERELMSARREAHRAGSDARREHALRDVTAGPASDLVRTLDLDQLALRLLDSVRSRTGAGVTALLLPGPDGAFRPWAILGDRFDRVRGLTVSSTGDVASLLTGIRRPKLIAEIEGMCERPAEVRSLVAGRWLLVAPLAGPLGLEGIVLAEERADGGAFQREDADALAVLSELAAVALGNARTVRAQSAGLLVAAEERLYHGERAAVSLVESRALLETNRDSLGLLPGEADAAWHALGFVDIGAAEVCVARDALASVAERDPSGLARNALILLDRARAALSIREDESDAPASLFRALRDYQLARARGTTVDRALARAAAVAAHPAVAETLKAAAANPNH